MQTVADRPEAPNAIRNDLGAIFVSMELSRSTWLITSLSPGGGEKMSKHGMPAGNVDALLARFAELRCKAFTRTGASLPIIVIQEAGLDGFWIHRASCMSTGSKDCCSRKAYPATSRCVATAGDASERHFPISISADRRPVRLLTETGSRSALRVRRWHS